MSLPLNLGLGLGLGSVPNSATGGAPPGESIRITDDNSERITDTGDVRVTSD